MNHAALLMEALILIISSSLSGCITAGIAEPSMFICTVIEPTVLECVHTYDNNSRKDINIIDAIGFQCVSPTSFGQLKTHHQVLHEELNKK